VGARAAGILLPGYTGVVPCAIEQKNYRTQVRKLKIEKRNAPKQTKAVGVAKWRFAKIAGKRTIMTSWQHKNEKQFEI
jgi:hypothetical protein